MRSKGFTLIELMVSLAVLAVLATAAVPAFELVGKRNKEQELRLALRQIRNGIDAYKQAYDEGKIPRKIDATGYPPSLNVLAEGVADATRPDKRIIYFMRRIPRDPFYPDQKIPAEQTWGLRSYASSSAEPREGADVYDVYSLSNANGLNGQPYRSW